LKRLRSVSAGRSKTEMFDWLHTVKWNEEIPLALLVFMVWGGLMILYAWARYFGEIGREWRRENKSGPKLSAMTSFACAWGTVLLFCQPSRMRIWLVLTLTAVVAVGFYVGRTYVHERKSEHRSEIALVEERASIGWKHAERHRSMLWMYNQVLTADER